MGRKIEFDYYGLYLLKYLQEENDPDKRMTISSTLAPKPLPKSLNWQAVRE